eukprot:881167-Pleurochrysis_carterae.AAC.5
MRACTSMVASGVDMYRKKCVLVVTKGGTGTSPKNSKRGLEKLEGIAQNERNDSVESGRDFMHNKDEEGSMD